MSSKETRQRNKTYVDQMEHQVNKYMKEKKYQKVLAACETGLIRVKGFSVQDMDPEEKVKSIMRLNSIVASAYEQLGDYKQATHFTQKAKASKVLKMSTKHDYTDERIVALDHLIRLSKIDNNLDRVFELMEQKLGLLSGNPSGMLTARLEISKMYYKHNFTQKALFYAEVASKQALKMKDSTLHCECLLWSAEMLIKEERKIEAKAKLKQILQKATVGSKLERKAQQMMKILDDGHHSDSTTSIDINVLEIDDKNERSGSMVHQVPLPIDDDDSFMPPSSRDSRGQLITFETHYDPRNKADSDPNVNFWQLREQDAMKPPAKSNARRLNK
ncbi:uncharacterized protein LOC142335396 isoform X2 [Convolutriloba macropyga]|uniref:uncharacterized protein LOC142335396 isoform X2 n=1 Tax=Convolutriloba macropyga TaxID=536237 RepID=UPI003F51B097